LIGAAIGVITNGINNVVHDRAFFKGAGKAALFGAIGGAASFGIGTLATNIASSAGSLARSAFQAGAHSLLGGTLSAMDGGNFWSGALAGGISSAIASGVGAFGIKSNTWKSIAGIGGGSVSGGIGSVIAGGNFWNGFGQGALTAGLNHFAHSKYEKIRQANYTKEVNAQLEATRKFFEALKQTNVLDPDPFYSDMYALGKFIELVGPGGPYDLKNDKNSIFSINKLRKYDGKAMYNGEVFKAEDFGNYNFGVAAKAFGLSLSFSQFGAGIVQILSGTSSWDFMNTYFDDPRDTYMIGRGYNHFD